jgi:hypothetical protein
MNISSQIAKHLRDVYSGGNWTTVNFKETLADITWKEANKRMDGFNSIASVVYHTGYYLPVQIKVLEGGPLEGNDKLSWDLPPLPDNEAWENLKQQCYTKAEKLASLIEKLPDEKLNQDFLDARYGTWFRNMIGMIEHLHYHLGQIVIIKKLIRKS